MIKQEIKVLLQTVLSELGYSFQDEIVIEIPKNKSFGDYATNICFTLARTLKKNPKIIAEEISEQLNNQKAISEVGIISAFNGFLNISLLDLFLWDKFNALIDVVPQFPKSEQKVMLEYVSANPTGPLHIGHGRWAVLGSALDSILRFIGVDVASEFYINDAGNQIKNFYKSVEAVKNGKPVPEDGYHGDYVVQLAASDEDALEQVIAIQKKTLNNLGAKFDTWFSEKRLHKSGEVEKAIQLLKSKELTYEKENALWFKSSDFGDEKDRVLVKSDGAYTYFVVDIAYHLNKIERGFGKLVNIWGADHHGYIARMRAGVAAVGGEQFLQEDNFVILIGQLVSLMRNNEPVRMSKRTGEMISLDEVVEEIGVDATRYFLLEKSADTHIEFDLELAKKKSNENPVFYVQYAHARICSIFNKLGVEKPSKVNITDLEQAEKELVLACLKVYDEIWDAARYYAPYKLVSYTYNLARAFHHFYEKCPIAKASEAEQAKRLVIIGQTKRVLAFCLEILGITSPTSM
jgi:arginyl-tRNA synthetase